MNITDRLIVSACCSCGITYATPESWDKQRHIDKANMYCPNGHSQVYRESDADKLRRQLLSAEAERDFARQQRDAAEKKAERKEREVKRILRRANAGVCQDCHRTFQDVAKHRATKHGDEAARKMTAAPRLKK
jgi:hypothetical protein